VIRDLVDGLVTGITDIGITPTVRGLFQLPNWHKFAVAYFTLQKKRFSAYAIALIGLLRVSIIDIYF